MFNPCDDGDPCTLDECDPVEGCSTTVVSGVSCDDGELCTEDDTCTDGSCSGTPVICDDGNGCTADSCDPQTGCLFVDTNLGCDDGNACTVGDQCNKGECVSGQGAVCDDGNACTNDACDPLNGCLHTPHDGGCSDGSACTLDDQCVEGTCQSGSPASCDDGNLCTADSCDPVVGCVNAANQISCDDGNLCSVGDVCSNGSCEGKTPLCVRMVAPVQTIPATRKLAVFLPPWMCHVMTEIHVRPTISATRAFAKGRGAELQ